MDKKIYNNIYDSLVNFVPWLYLYFIYSQFRENSVIYIVACDYFLKIFKVHQYNRCIFIVEIGFINNKRLFKLTT